MLKALFGLRWENFRNLLRKSCSSDDQPSRSIVRFLDYKLDIEYRSIPARGLRAFARFRSSSSETRLR